MDFSRVFGPVFLQRPVAGLRRTYRSTRRPPAYTYTIPHFLPGQRAAIAIWRAGGRAASAQGFSSSSSSFSVRILWIHPQKAETETEREAPGDRCTSDSGKLLGSLRLRRRPRVRNGSRQRCADSQIFALWVFFSPKHPGSTHTFPARHAGQHSK